MEQREILWISVLVTNLFFSCSFSEEKTSSSKNNNEETVIELKNDSVHYEYYDDGDLKSKSVYQEGRRHGLYESYWPNGNLYCRVMYENGARSGFYESFDSTSQKLLRRVEYIKNPNKYLYPDDLDYVNRIWDFIEGDTNSLSTGSTIYKIVLDSLGKSFKLLSHFAVDESDDGFFDDYLLIVGDDVTNPDTTIEMGFHKSDKQLVEYSFSKKDLERGYVEGAVAADDVYEINEEKSIVSRKLFFRWNIKEGKLENHLIGE